MSYHDDNVRDLALRAVYANIEKAIGWLEAGDAARAVTTLRAILPRGWPHSFEKPKAERPSKGHSPP